MDNCTEGHIYLGKISINRILFVFICIFDFFPILLLAQSAETVIFLYLTDRTLLWKALNNLFLVKLCTISRKLLTKSNSSPN